MKGNNNPFNWRWIVKIPTGQFMAGTHRFRLKKEAEAFAEQWRRTNANGMEYGSLPTVVKVENK